MNTFNAGRKFAKNITDIFNNGDGNPPVPHRYSSSPEFVIPPTQYPYQQNPLIMGTRQIQYALPQTETQIAERKAKQRKIITTLIIIAILLLTVILCGCTIPVAVAHPLLFGIPLGIFCTGLIASILIGLQGYYKLFDNLTYCLFTSQGMAEATEETSSWCFRCFSAPFKCCGGFFSRLLCCGGTNDNHHEGYEQIPNKKFPPPISTAVGTGDNKSGADRSQKKNSSIESFSEKQKKDTEEEKEEDDWENQTSLNDHEEDTAKYSCQ